MTSPVGEFASLTTRGRDSILILFVCGPVRASQQAQTKLGASGPDPGCTCLWTSRRPPEIGRAKVFPHSTLCTPSTNERPRIARLATRQMSPWGGATIPASTSRAPEDDNKQGSARHAAVFIGHLYQDGDRPLASGRTLGGLLSTESRG